MSNNGSTRMPHRQIWQLIALVMLVQVFAQFVRSIAVIDLREDGVSLHTAKNVTYFVVIPFLVVMLYPVWREHKSLIVDRLRFEQLTLNVVIGGILLGFALRMAVHAKLIAEAGFGLIRNASTDAVAGPTIAWSCPPAVFVALHFVAMGVVAPLAEEIVNRGWILQWLKRYGRFVAVTGSSFFFMIMHEPGTRAMVMPLVLGIFVSIHVLNSGTLWAAVIAHGTSNTLIILDWMCLRYNWNPVETSTATAATAVIALLGGFFALAFSALLVSRRIAGFRSGDPPTAP